MKLYELTGEEKHRRLAKYFIDQRGQAPLYFAQEVSDKPFHWKNTSYEYQYYQAGRPVREQKEAQGHAVRAVYLYSGMADVARSTEDEGLWEALEGLWNNMTKRRMYITGAIGSSHVGEAFTYDYDLPNDTVYGETCASVGLVFLAKRMLSIEPKGAYGDVMERALYNGVISGMNLAGDRFFYVNPLEVLPEASRKDEGKRHVKPNRQKWFHCACCPPNLARLLSSLGDYIYGVRERTLFVHLYMGSRVEADLQGQNVRLQVQTRYPWEEEIRIQVETCEEGDWTLALRIPGWCRQYVLTCGKDPVAGVERDGYLYVTRSWKPGDEILLKLRMPVEKIEANPRVREDIGKAAIMRGPLVYCLEEADNGKDLHRIRLAEQEEWEVCYEPDLLCGVVTISAMGEVQNQTDWEEDTLYRPFARERYEPKRLKWIPTMPGRIGQKERCWYGYAIWRSRVGALYALPPGMRRQSAAWSERSVRGTRPAPGRESLSSYVGGALLIRQQRIRHGLFQRLRSGLRLLSELQHQSGRAGRHNGRTGSGGYLSEAAGAGRT